MKVYLAGKIGHTDWRHEIVAGLRSDSGWHPRGIIGEYLQPEPGYILKDAMRDKHQKHDYTGPYFVSDDHGCAHRGESTHGTGVNGEPTCFNPPSRYAVVNMCLCGILASDVVFAWIDSLDAYGTIAEIGFAVSNGKKVFIAGPEKHNDLWFVYELAVQSGGKFIEARTPKSALDVMFVSFAADGTELTPIEEVFYCFWTVDDATTAYNLIPQYELFKGKYRLDFAEPILMVGVELDGFAFHSTKAQLTKDRKRQREIEAAGWRVIRFSGSEVWKDPGACVEEVLTFLKQVAGEAKDKA